MSKVEIKKNICNKKNSNSESETTAHSQANNSQCILRKKVSGAYGSQNNCTCKASQKKTDGINEAFRVSDKQNNKKTAQTDCAGHACRAGNNSDKSVDQINSSYNRCSL